MNENKKNSNHINEQKRKDIKYINIKINPSNKMNENKKNSNHINEQKRKYKYINNYLLRKYKDTKILS